MVPSVSPPVHQHRTWRHLQRAAVSAHRELGLVTQSNFCALMTPAASIAVWILQQAPHLARLDRLRVLVVEATAFECLDKGRWFQFIPWLLGRPAMTVEISLVGSALLDETERKAPAATLDALLRSHSWKAVEHLAPATLRPGGVKDWLDDQDGAGGAKATPDICAVFSPSLPTNFDTLLAEDGLLCLARKHVPLALFSPSEAGQLMDVYTLRAAGLRPRDSECWPNPWALPTPNAEHASVYAKLGWAAEFDSVPVDAPIDLTAMNELADALVYAQLGPLEDGPDGVLSLGEPLRAAAGSSANPNIGHEVDAVLLRLPNGVAVDSRNGHIYQLQDATALLLEEAQAVPPSALNRFPGNTDLLQRVIWAVGVHRDFVAPYIGHIDEATKSEFSTSGEDAQSGSQGPGGTADSIT